MAKIPERDAEKETSYSVNNFILLMCNNYFFLIRRSIKF